MYDYRPSESKYAETESDSCNSSPYLKLEDLNNRIEMNDSFSIDEDNVSIPEIGEIDNKKCCCALL